MKRVELYGRVRHAVIVQGMSGREAARVWDATTGSQFTLLESHEDSRNSVAFSPDGRRVVTASTDADARVLDVFQTTQDLIDHA